MGQGFRTRWRFNIGMMICLSVLLGGCFQPAGSSLEPTTVDLAALTALAPTPTLFVTPLPTVDFHTPTPEQFFPTAIPTETLAPPSPMPTEIPTETPVESMTEVPTTIPIFPTQVIETPTEMPTLEPSPTTFLLPTPTAFPTENPCIHTVQAGEWLLKIARDFGVDAQVLINANPFLAGNPNALQPGVKLVIPNCQPPAAPTTPPQEGAPVVQPTSELATPIILTDRIYIVVAGDTLGAIARKFGITVQALKDANNLTNDFLRIGQQLKIPAP